MGLGGNKAGFTEDTQVMTDRGLPCARFLHEVAGAHLFVGKQPHDLGAKWVAEEPHGCLGDIGVGVRGMSDFAFIGKCG